MNTSRPTERNPMTDFPASHRDLLDGHYAMLSTIAPSGHPQTTAIVFLHDDDGEMPVSLKETRQRTGRGRPGQGLRREGRGEVRPGLFGARRPGRGAGQGDAAPDERERGRPLALGHW